MANGTWKRSTAASRRAERQVRYAHTSVLVGVNKDPVTGMLTATRTPKGEGSTATRKEPRKTKRGRLLVPKTKGHDWAGAYPGRLASLEALRRTRRNARKAGRAQAVREAYFIGVAQDPSKMLAVALDA